MKIFIIGIYTFDAILLLWVLYRNYRRKMEALNEKEKIYSSNNDN